MSLLACQGEKVSNSVKKESNPSLKGGRAPKALREKTREGRRGRLRDRVHAPTAHRTASRAEKDRDRPRTRRRSKGLCMCRSCCNRKREPAPAPEISHKGQASNKRQAKEGKTRCFTGNRETLAADRKNTPVSRGKRGACG